MSDVGNLVLGMLEIYPKMLEQKLLELNIDINFQEIQKGLLEVKHGQMATQIQSLQAENERLRKEYQELKEYGDKCCLGWNEKVEELTEVLRELMNISDYGLYFGPKTFALEKFKEKYSHLLSTNPAKSTDLAEKMLKDKE